MSSQVIERAEMDVDDRQKLFMDNHGVKVCIDSSRPWCFVCGQQDEQHFMYGGYTNIFESLLSCSQRKLATCLASALSTNIEVDSAFSQVICIPCQELAEKAELLEMKLLTVQEELRTLHHKTLWLLESGELRQIQAYSAIPESRSSKQPRKTQQVPREELPEYSIPEPWQKKGRGRPVKQGLNAISMKTDTNITTLDAMDLNKGKKPLKSAAEIVTPSSLVMPKQEFPVETEVSNTCVTPDPFHLKRKRGKKTNKTPKSLTASSVTLEIESEYSSAFEPESDEDRKDRNPDFKAVLKSAKRLCRSSRCSQTKVSATLDKASEEQFGQFVQLVALDNSSVDPSSHETGSCIVTNSTATAVSHIWGKSIDADEVNISNELFEDMNGENENVFDEELLIKDEKIYSNSYNLNGLSSSEQFQNTLFFNNNDLRRQNGIICVKEDLFEQSSESNNCVASYSGDSSLRNQTEHISTSTSVSYEFVHMSSKNELVENMCAKMKQMFASTDTQTNDSQFSFEEDPAMGCASQLYDSKDNIGLTSEALAQSNDSSQEMLSQNCDNKLLSQMSLDMTPSYLMEDDQSSPEYFCDICGLDFEKVEQLKNHIELDHFSPNY